MPPLVRRITTRHLAALSISLFMRSGGPPAHDVSTLRRTHKVVNQLGIEHTPPAHQCYEMPLHRPLALLAGISIFADTEGRQFF